MEIGAHKWVPLRNCRRILKQIATFPVNETVRDIYIRTEITFHSVMKKFLFTLLFIPSEMTFIFALIFWCTIFLWQNIRMRRCFLSNDFIRNEISFPSKLPEQVSFRGVLKDIRDWPETKLKILPFWSKWNLIPSYYHYKLKIWVTSRVHSDLF